MASSKRVRFKGDNGKYLEFRDPYLNFSSESIDNGNRSAHFQVIEEDGYCRIKSEGSGRYWKVEVPHPLNPFALVTADGDQYEDSTAFSLLKVGERVCFACRTRNNNSIYICSRLTEVQFQDYLAVAPNSIPDEAKLYMEEVAGN